MQSLTDRSKGTHICMHDRETEIADGERERGKDRGGEFSDITGVALCMC